MIFSHFGPKPIAVKGLRPGSSEPTILHWCRREIWYDDGTRIFASAEGAAVYFIRVFIMAVSINGELVPVGGGESIPLARTPLTIGRRESCDISLQFPNISGKHCELSFRDGYWSIRDLNSANGIKVNGNRVSQRPLKSGDELAIAKRKYTIQYSTTAEAQRKLEEMLTEEDDIFGKSLLEKAGLLNPRSGDADKSYSTRLTLDDDED
jgi:pSer/pThr/pTyr-binding forkhead associated (FHA) protein